MMMLYQRRASPKLRDDMTEVEYGGGGHRTRLRQCLLPILGCPLPPYIKEQGGGRPALGRAKEGRNPPPSRSRIPPFLVLLGGGRKEGGEGEGKGGAAPPLLVQFRPEGEGARGPPWPPLSLPTKAHVAH